MKTLIIYDDVTRAANTNAVLHRVAHRADMAVKWDIRPWRLNMLKLPATAGLALRDAVDAHLIVFAVRRINKPHVWLMNWLEQWAALRQTHDAALCFRGRRNGQSVHGAGTGWALRWTPSFRPRSAENKMDSAGLLSFIVLFVCRSFCASKPFRKERTSRAWHCPSSLSVFLGFPILTAAGGLISSLLSSSA